VKEKIYIIKTYPDCYKIGISFNPEQRIITLQTANPFKLKIILEKEVNDAFKIEQTIHEAFKEKRLEGEWFSLTDDELKTIVDYLNQHC